MNKIIYCPKCKNVLFNLNNSFYCIKCNNHFNKFDKRYFESFEKRLKGIILKNSFRNFINRKILIDLCERLYIYYLPEYKNSKLAMIINLEFINNGYSEVILWDEKRRFWFLMEMWKIVEGKYKKGMRISLL